MRAYVLASLTAHARSSGTSSPTPFAYFDRPSLSWRTSQVSLLPDSESSSLTWPKRATTVHGAAFEPPTSVPRTAASESTSLLPTPAAYESTPTDTYIAETRENLDDPHKRLYLPGRKWHAQRTLSRIAPLLPTPTANDGPDRRNETGVDTFGRPNLGRPGAHTSPPSDGGNNSPDQPHRQLTLEDASNPDSSNGCSDSPTNGPTA